MKFKYIAVVGLILFLASCQSSGDSNTETGTLEQRSVLVLTKRALFISQGRRGSDCGGVNSVEGGRDVPDMRRLSNFFCQGTHTFTLSGRKGTTVSLYGRFNFQKENGFMVIVKRDNRDLWVTNLDHIPSGKWVSVEAGRRTGAYEVYFNSVPRFSQRISSVKWEKWWEGDTPQ